MRQNFLVVAVPWSSSKPRSRALRFYRYQELLAASFRVRHPRHYRNATGVIMLVAHLDPLAASLFSLMAIASLLLAFVMLGSRWLNNYLYAFAAESWIIAGLSAAVGFYGNYPELYLIAILTALFRGCTPALSGLAHHRATQCRRAKSMKSCSPARALVAGAVLRRFSRSSSPIASGSHSGLPARSPFWRSPSCCR